MKHFVRYFARFLSNAACSYMSFGGIYLTSTVVYALEFLLEEGSEGRKEFVREFVESRGPGMAKYIGQIPLKIVKAEGELAMRGCIKYALENNLMQ